MHKNIHTLLIAFLFPAALLSQPDTLDDYYQRAASLISIPAPAGGYIFGTGWDDVGFPCNPCKISEETGVHYTGVGNAIVTEVLIWFTDTVIAGAPDTLEVRVYNTKADSTPVGGALGKGLLPVSGISLSGFTPVSILPDTAYVTGDFTVSLRYKYADDTIGIAASDTASNDGLGEKRTWLKLAQIGYWIQAYDIYDSVKLDVDAMLIPVVEYVLIGTEEMAFGGMRRLPPYPNPAAGEVTIGYSLQKAQKVRLRVFGLSGKALYDSGNALQPAGKHRVAISTAKLESGPYYYTISTEGKQLTGRFMVSH